MPRCARCFGELTDLAVFCPSCHQPHQPAFEQLLGQVVGGRYQIYRRLSKGGLSTVFSAIDLHTDEIVVVKLSDPGHLTRRELTYALATEEARQYWAEMLERMRREAEALLEIRHPNIVQLYGTGTLTDELRYVVMEFLRGQTLREELAARGKLPLPEALTIASALAEALRAIHSRGIVHRDLNPHNVMRCPNEDTGQTDIKLIDFGIAKFPQPPGAPPFTQHSILSGTVAYASPEQCQNLPLDQRADLYSLAVVLYEMVTGERPFTGRTPTEIALNQIQQAPRPPRSLVPELPLSLEALLLRALAKQPDQRQANIVEFINELQAIAQRVIVALPEKTVIPVPSLQPVIAPAVSPTTPLSGPTLPPANDAQTTETTEPALFTAYAPARTTRGKKLAYAAGLTLLLGGGLWAYEHAQGRATLPSIAQLTERLTPSAAAPLEASRNNNLADQTTPPTSATPEADLAAPEAQMAHVGESLATATAPPTTPNKFNAAKASRGLAPVMFKTSAQPTPIVLTPPTPVASIFTAPAALPAPDLPALAPVAPDLALGPAVNGARRRAGRELPVADQSGLGSRPRPASNDTDKANSIEPSFEERVRAEREAEAERRDFAPKVIAWSGAVRGERIVRLEMPGVPGSVEIPRIYRKRVGIIEPPCDENQWRMVALRVYGRGEVSVVLRWWPK